jgi:hypothetical protein
MISGSAWDQLEDGDKCKEKKSRSLRPDAAAKDGTLFWIILSLLHPKCKSAYLQMTGKPLDRGVLDYIDKDIGMQN